MAGAFDHVLVRCQLRSTDRAAGVHPPGRNTNLCAHAKLTTIGKLGGGVVDDDGGVNLSLEPRCGVGIGGDDRFGVVRSVCVHVRNRLIKIINDPNSQD